MLQSRCWAQSAAKFGTLPCGFEQMVAGLEPEEVVGLQPVEDTFFVFPLGGL